MASPKLIEHNDLFVTQRPTAITQRNALPLAKDKFLDRFLRIYANRRLFIKRDIQYSLFEGEVLQGLRPVHTSRHYRPGHESCC